MPSAADTLIARLQADCTAAEAAERAVRAEVEAQLKEAERARAFAWRRLSALGDMPRLAALEPAREIAVERQLPDAAAARKLREVEADVKADPLVLNRGRFFDREGRHMRIDEVAQ